MLPSILGPKYIFNKLVKFISEGLVQLLSKESQKLHPMGNSQDKAKIIKQRYTYYVVKSAMVVNHRAGLKLLSEYAEICKEITKLGFIGDPIRRLFNVYDINSVIGVSKITIRDKDAKDALLKPQEQTQVSCAIFEAYNRTIILKKNWICPMDLEEILSKHPEALLKVSLYKVSEILNHSYIKHDMQAAKHVVLTRNSESSKNQSIGE